jgi:BirA family transcriptional regulator, biotin operon repressor / biotin---[acetyl-CoA-carboxylase] ligase
VNLDDLRRVLPDRRIDYYPTIDSTMRAAAALPLGSIVIAGEQTAGQGRHGHSWHSEPGNGIYCSIVLDPAPALTLAIGLATVEAITESTGITCDLRWPNDVMLDGKKCAGILVQLVEGKAIAGIGINVNHTKFPPDLAAEATSLRMHIRFPTPDSRPLAPILAALIPAVERYAALPLEEILELFSHASSYVFGRRVVVNEIHGLTAGLDSDGFLKVRQDDGTVTLILAGGVRAVS